MKATRTRTVGWVAVLGAVACVAQAASTGNTGSRGSLVASESLAPFSVGADFEQVNRDVKAGGAGHTLKARSYTAYVGFDVARWLTVYGTVGQVEAQLLGGRYDDGDLAWSVGVDASLWHIDLIDPSFLEGRLSLRAVAEYAEASAQEGGDDLSWQEVFTALTLNYEIFVDEPKAMERTPYSLVLYTGPLHSVIDGDQDAAGVSVEEDSRLGFVLGADLFLAHNLALGFSLQQFDHTSYRGGLRYHF